MEHGTMVMGTESNVDDITVGTPFCLKYANGKLIVLIAAEYRRSKIQKNDHGDMLWDVLGFPHG